MVRGRQPGLNEQESGLSKKLAEATARKGRLQRELQAGQIEFKQMSEELAVLKVELAAQREASQRRIDLLEEQKEALAKEAEKIDLEA
jgi:hypothetical protein